MGQTVTVLLEKEGTRKEVEVLIRIERGREEVWLKEKTRPHKKRTKEMMTNRPLKTMTQPWKKRTIGQLKSTRA